MEMERLTRPGCPSISLGDLIDMIIQRTYHELTVLAELLPRKTDLERKIEIYNFSARTRQLFIRLLALVKWANSASKVDQCSNIMHFLDKQSMLFIETADMLADMARKTLIQARLPNFHIPAAIEVLTTGTYNKLPACIKEKIVPADPITPAEKKITLNRLDQVIQHRLVTGNLIPQMRKFKVESGQVTFTVDHEFEVSLTVMGDTPIPWRLLDIDILVEDRQTGDGKSLVHPLQVNYIHQLVQARLIDNQNALTEVYKCLHYFCQSLQLEVMYTQTLRLCRDRLDDHIHVDEYIPGSKLSVSYWRELSNKDPRPELGYKLTVQTDILDPAKPLAVYHVPSIGGTKESEVADRAVRSDMLSMERLLVHTVYVRTLSRLSDLKAEFKTFLKDLDFHLQGTPAILTVPVLYPCLRAEQVHITVDTHSGRLHCHVPKHLDCPLMNDMQTALNNDTSKLPNLISELRYWITKRRCEKTLQHLPATLYDKLPLLHAPDHQISKISRHKAYIQLHRHPNAILIAEMKEKNSDIDFVFYLVFVSKFFGESTASAAATSSTDDGSDCPKLFYKVQSIIEFDTFLVTHGPGTSIEGTTSNKRKANSHVGNNPKQAKTIYPAYFIPELAHVVAMCDEKLPFVNFGQELTKRKIPHCGVQVEANATSLVLKLLKLPMPQALENGPVVDKTVWEALMKQLLSVCVRVQKSNAPRLWMIELIFYSSPIPSVHRKEQSQRRPVYLQYEMLPAQHISDTIDAILNDWSRIVYLYSLVYDFAEVYNKDKFNLKNLVTVRSYNYTNLVLAYGPKKDINLSISWCMKTKKFLFTSSSVAINAHSIMRDQLQSHLNRNLNLAQIVHILHETYQPLASISKLPILPHLGIAQLSHKLPVLSFAIVPQSPTMIRLSFQETYCLEIRFRGGGLVSVRDGAYSRFDRSNVVGELTPTQGLKGFLSKYVDENAIDRRRSQTEDDNPPSPTVEEIQGGPASVGSTSFLSTGLRGPQSPREPGGMRSNPHTPASPMSQQQQHPNLPHPNFNLTSPPAASHLPHPSPGNMMPASPLNPQPSPLAAHSPGPNSLPYMQTHAEQSPFAALSPAASNWPGSPGMPRPSPRPGQSPDHKPQIAVGPHISRVLPARSWAGAVPTLLTYEALDVLCRPCPHPQNNIPSAEMSPLERFLGCVFMRRQLQRLIQSEEMLTLQAPIEPGMVLFKVENLQYQIFLNPNHMQSLHMKVIQMNPIDGKQMYPWNPEDLQIFEQYFDTKVAAPPYRYNELLSFVKMIVMPPVVLKDLIQIIRLEMMPELTQGFRWNVQLCLRVPPSPCTNNVIPIGRAGIMYQTKIIFFLQICHNWSPTTLVLPMVYDSQINSTNLVERRQDPLNAVRIHLCRFGNEYAAQMHAECSLFPAVRELLMNFALPNEQIPPQMQGPMGGPVPQQMMGSPNPNMMGMNSPMAAGYGQMGPGVGPPQ